MADAEALGAFRAGQYAPDRLVISAAGAVDEAELLALSERLFGGEPASAGAASEPATFAAGFTAEARKLEQAHTVLLLPGVGARDDAYFAQRLFAEALGGGMSSRLFQEARERLGLAYAVDAYGESYADTGLMGVYAGTTAANAGRTAEGRRARDHRPDHGHRGRRAPALPSPAQGFAVHGAESSLARAEQAAGQVLLFDRLFTAGEIAEAVDAVGPADIRAFGTRMLDAAIVAGAVLGPKPALKAARRSSGAVRMKTRRGYRPAADGAAGVFRPRSCETPMTPLRLCGRRRAR